MGPNKIERFINLLRDTHSSIPILYQYGGCYQLFLILRELHPNAQAWYDWEMGHVYTKIDKYWYDINGKHLKINPSATVMDYGHFVRRPDRWKNCLNNRYELRDKGILINDSTRNL